MSDSFPGQKLARLYGWITVVAVVYGLLAAHLPALLGHPWDSCSVGGVPCVLSYHLYEVPIVLYQVVFAWYTLARLRAETVATFRALLIGALAFDAAFGLFEVTLLLETVRAGGPVWEQLALASLVVTFQAGVILGAWILSKVRSAA